MTDSQLREKIYSDELNYNNEVMFYARLLKKMDISIMILLEMNISLLLLFFIVISLNLIEVIGLKRKLKNLVFQKLDLLNNGKI